MRLVALMKSNIDLTCESIFILYQIYKIRYIKIRNTDSFVNTMLSKKCDHLGKEKVWSRSFIIS